METIERYSWRQRWALRVQVNLLLMPKLARA